MKSAVLILLLLVTAGAYVYINPSSLEEGYNHRVFLDELMVECKAQLSPIKRNLLIARISRVSDEYFHNTTEKQAFALLICIESKFNEQARSSAGAVGLMQIIPKYSQEFADKCNIGILNKDDLMDPEINLSVGACWFGHLIKTHKNIVLALAAYNSGLSSTAVRKLGQLESINPETANYIAKFEYLRRSMSIVAGGFSSH